MRSSGEPNKPAERTRKPFAALPYSSGGRAAYGQCYSQNVTEYPIVLHGTCKFGRKAL